MKLLSNPIGYILLFLSSAFIAKADGFSYDILTFSIDGKEYHLIKESKGKFKDNDFCYYDYDGLYIGEVEEVIHEVFRKKEKVEVYQKMETINLRNIPGYGYPNGSKRKFHILKEPILLTSKEMGNKFELISINEGNTFGRIFTEELNTLDNYWIDEYPLEELFEFSDNEICEMSLFAIKGNISTREKNRLKKRVEKAVLVRQLDDLLSELYERHIFMLGFCSC